MAGQFEPPERDAPAVLHRAYARARSIGTAWRLRFSIPATDPRYLEATEDEIIEDMLTCAYYDALAEEHHRPLDALRKKMERHGAEFDEEDAAAIADATDGEMAARLRKVVEVIEPIRRLERIVMRGQMTS